MRSEKELNKIAEKLWKIEVEVEKNPSKMNEAILEIEKIASRCSFEELLFIDDAIYQKYSDANT